MSLILLCSGHGGCGKTAAAVNLSHLASLAGEPTLLLDWDPQGAASYYFRVRPAKKFGSRRLLQGGKKASRQIKGTDFPGLDILPAHPDYWRLDRLLAAPDRPRGQLRRLLKQLAGPYATALLDCPAGLSLLAGKLLRLVDMVVVPVLPTAFSVRAFDLLCRFCADHKLPPAALMPFFSRVAEQEPEHTVIRQELQGREKRLAFSFIPESAAVAAMDQQRQPVTSFHPASLAARGYASLWRELRTRLHPDAR